MTDKFPTEVRAGDKAKMADLRVGKVREVTVESVEGKFAVVNEAGKRYRVGTTFLKKA